MLPEHVEVLQPDQHVQQEIQIQFVQVEPAEQDVRETHVVQLVELVVSVEQEAIRMLEEQEVMPAQEV